MNWLVTLKEKGKGTDPGSTWRGKAHFVHEDKRGVTAKFTDGREVFVSRSNIKLFHKRPVKK